MEKGIELKEEVPKPSLYLKGRREYIRFRCPLCGLRPYIEQLEASPYKFRVFLQRLEGCKSLNIPLPPPFEKRGRGRPKKIVKASGSIYWEDITEEVPEFSEEIASKVREKIEEIRNFFTV